MVKVHNLGKDVQWYDLQTFAKNKVHLVPHTIQMSRRGEDAACLAYLIFNTPDEASEFVQKVPRRKAVLKGKVAYFETFSSTEGGVPCQDQKVPKEPKS